MDSNNLYFVLTADIIGSRKKPAAVKEAAEKLSMLNRRFHCSLAVPFTLFRGDEIQGVARPSEQIPRLIRQFRCGLRPLALRIGIGLGAISQGLELEYSWQMDGSAFHRSREALQRVSRSRSQATCLLGGPAAPVEQFNVIYTLLDAIQDRWSEKQWQAVDAYDRGGTFERAARELKITAQSVNKHCMAARFSAVAGAERYLEACMKELL